VDFYGPQKAFRNVEERMHAGRVAELQSETHWNLRQKATQNLRSGAYVSASLGCETHCDRNRHTAHVIFQFRDQIRNL